MADPRSVDRRNPGRMHPARICGISVRRREGESVVVDRADADHLSGIGRRLRNRSAAGAVSVYLLATQSDSGRCLCPVAVTLPVGCADRGGVTGDAGTAAHGL